MAVAIQADPDQDGFNCYTTVSEANDYHSTRLHNDAWTNAAVSDRTKALLWASRQLDSLNWKGARTEPGQPKEFPRIGLYMDSGDYSWAHDLLSSYMLDAYSIPDFLKDTTAELAFWLLSQDYTAPTGLEGYKSIKVDTIAIEVDSTTTQSWLTNSVRSLCWRWLVSSSKYSAPVERV